MVYNRTTFCIASMIMIHNRTTYERTHMIIHTYTYTQYFYFIVFILFLCLFFIHKSNAKKKEKKTFFVLMLALFFVFQSIPLYRCMLLCVAEYVFSAHFYFEIIFLAGD